MRGSGAERGIAAVSLLVVGVLLVFVMTEWSGVGGALPTPRAPVASSDVSLEPATRRSDDDVDLAPADARHGSRDGRVSTVRSGGRIRVVDERGEPLSGRARCRSLDPGNRGGAWFAFDGSFDPSGPAPHAVEVRCPGFATASVVVLDDAPAVVAAHRSGSVCVSVRSANGRPVAGREVVLLRPFARLAPLGERDVRREALARRFDGARLDAEFAWEESRDVATIAAEFRSGASGVAGRVGGGNVVPAVPDRIFGTTDADGVVRFDALAAGTSYRFATEPGRRRARSEAGRRSAPSGGGFAVSGPFDVVGEVALAVT
ncbi:MAG: hypothetical protein R3F34_19830 [Planctomycetota bacterium]